MSTSGPIVWLASYPKSGNTWVRALLTGYFGKGSVDINALDGGGISRSRVEFDDITGMSSSDLTQAEVDLYRPDFHRVLAEQLEGPWFIKTHEPWARNRAGVPIFPADISRGAVCIVRDPRDAAISFAHHRVWSIDKTIAFMNDGDAALDRWPNKITANLPEPLSTWSGNIASWLDQGEMPVLLIRYEELLRDPAGGFSELLRFAGVEPQADQISAAVAGADFSTLQAAEAASGFREKSASHQRFFREGRAGGWRETLSPGQAARIAQDHGDMMRRLGYGINHGPA